MIQKRILCEEKHRTHTHFPQLLYGTSVLVIVCVTQRSLCVSFV